MYIKSLTIKNIKSFGEETLINFQDGLNIFIGPNAGGKSNLMDILNIALIYFFLHPWRVISEYDETGTTLRRKYFEERHYRIFEPINQFLEKHRKRGGESQQIKIAFCLEREDIENIKNIFKHKEELINFEEEKYFNSRILNDKFFVHFEGINIDSLVGEKLEFIIKDNNLIQTDLEQKHQVFLKYLNFFGFLNLLIEEYNQNIEENTKKIPSLYPPLVYFSPYRISQVRNLTTTLSVINFFDLLEKYEKSDSKTVSSTFEVANYYFAKKLRYLDDKIELFNAEEEVELIKKYIRKLGYKDFGYECKNKERNTYEGFLIKMDGTKLDLFRASGGEKEILNLLLGVFAFNVKNGVIIIDEPELHLHPKWQKILIELFNDFIKTRGIQFFIVTHSPHFINSETIKNTIRVYLENGESKCIKVPELNTESKEIVQIVNTLNNEKIFFADKVILVEGIIDRLVFEAILDIFLKESSAREDSKTEVIEILDVQGNDNFEKYKNFLEKLRIKCYIISDLDYLLKIGDENIKKLFQVDYKKMDESIKEKTSKDGRQLLEKIDELLKKISPESQINGYELESLRDFFNYLKIRYVKIKEDISDQEKKEINAFIEKQYERKIFILKEGEIEKYFEGTKFDINDAIKISLEIREKRRELPIELKEIFMKITKD